MKYGFVFVILAIMLISTPGLPLVSGELGYVCDGNSSFYNWTMDGTLYNVTTPCPHGCSSVGMCLTDTSEGTFPVAYILGYVLIAAIMAYLSMNVDKEKHGHIQILFMFLSLFSVLSTIMAIQVVIDLQGIPLLGNANLNIYTAFFWSIFFVLAYLILMFIINLFHVVQDFVRTKKKAKRGGLEPIQS